jgi:hypothetical protein
MNKEFVPYEQALVLKELGFDEPCIRAYHTKEKLCVCSEIGYKNSQGFGMPTAPLYQQAFSWFREKYGFNISLTNDGYIALDTKKSQSYIDEADSYEEAELECLKKLIELCKNN